MQKIDSAAAAWPAKGAQTIRAAIWTREFMARMRLLEGRRLQLQLAFRIWTWSEFSLTATADLLRHEQLKHGQEEEEKVELIFNVAASNWSSCQEIWGKMLLRYRGRCALT